MTSEVSSSYLVNRLRYFISRNGYVKFLARLLKGPPIVISTGVVTEWRNLSLMRAFLFVVDLLVSLLKIVFI